MQLNPDIILNAATALEIDPTLIEKDWYTVQVLKAISEIYFEEFQISFGGGTSLSKAHKLVERFSEDLDFKIYSTTNSKIQRGARRKFREYFLNNINKTEGIELKDGSLISRDESTFFSLLLFYPQNFPQTKTLRPELKIDCTFQNPIIPTEERYVSSFINELNKDLPEVKIRCISPQETISDKFCALIWRVLNRDRQNKFDDPSLIRHLHDICAIDTKYSVDHVGFIQRIQNIYEIDKYRSASTENIVLLEAGLKVYNILSEDELYKKEYSKFVEEMSYAPMFSRISFEEALNNFHDLLKFLSIQ